jgi:hypothetical protein
MDRSSVQIKTISERFRHALAVFWGWLCRAGQFRVIAIMIAVFVKMVTGNVMVQRHRFVQMAHGKMKVHAAHRNMGWLFALEKAFAVIPVIMVIQIMVKSVVRRCPMARLR